MPTVSWSTGGAVSPLPEPNPTSRSLIRFSTRGADRGLPPPPGDPLRWHGHLRPAGLGGRPGGMGSHGRPHCPAMG
jgi:hypothetical protein